MTVTFSFIQKKYVSPCMTPHLHNTMNISENFKHDKGAVNHSWIKVPPTPQYVVIIHICHIIEVEH